MRTKQLSVFIENKTGSIREIARLLGGHGINMRAFSMAENSDFGILRLIVSDVEKAVRVLKQARFGVNVTPVAHIRTSNEPGSLACILEKLAERNIFIEYMYAFAEGTEANIIIRPTDLDRCIEVLTDEERRQADSGDTPIFRF